MAMKKTGAMWSCDSFDPCDLCDPCDTSDPCGQVGKFVLLLTFSKSQLKMHLYDSRASFRWRGQTLVFFFFFKKKRKPVSTISVGVSGRLLKLHTNVPNRPYFPADRNISRVSRRLVKRHMKISTCVFGKRKYFARFRGFFKCHANLHTWPFFFFKKKK